MNASTQAGWGFGANLQGVMKGRGDGPAGPWGDSVCSKSAQIRYRRRDSRFWYLFGCLWMCLENGGTWEERGAELLGCWMAVNAAGAEMGLGPRSSK